MNSDHLRMSAVNSDEIAMSDTAPIRAGYAEDLRALGQALEAQKCITVEVQFEGDGYRIRAEVDRNDGNVSFAAMIKHALISLGRSGHKKKTPAARCIELRYGRQEIETLVQQGISKRLDTHAVPDHFSLSHILREAGAYLDNLHDATLCEVIVEEHWITLRYTNSQGQCKELKQDHQFFYDYWVKMYLRRRVRSGPTLTSAHPTYITAFQMDPRLKG